MHNSVEPQNERRPRRISAARWSVGLSGIRWTLRPRRAERRGPRFPTARLHAVQE